MNIKYGKKIVETTYYDSKPVITESFTSRERVTSDSDELAHFIKLQQEHKASAHLIFERHVSDKGARYVIKTWRDK